MGNSSSDPRTLGDEIWLRDIKEMFTSSKMTEAFPFKIKDILSIIKSTESNSVHSYVLITETNKVICMSDKLPDIKHEYQFENETIRCSSSISNSQFAVSTEKALYIFKDINDELLVNKLEIENVSQILKLNDSSIVCITENIEVIHVSTDLQKQVLWASQGVQHEIVYAKILFNASDKPLLAVSCKDTFFFGPCTQNSPITQFKEYADTKMITNDRHVIYMVNSEQNKVLQCVLTPDLSLVSSVLKVQGAPENQKIVFLHVPRAGLLFVAFESFIITILLKDESFRSVDLPSGIITKAVLPLHRELFFVFICKNSRLALIRIPALGGERKEDYRYAELSTLHRSEITAFLSPAEAEFATFDEDGIMIIWENLPFWWNAPHFLDMFGVGADSSDERA